MAYEEDGTMSRRFIMRRKILALGQDFWVKDEAGNQVYYIDQKAFSLLKTYSILDQKNREVLKVQHQPISIRRTMDISRDGKLVASVQKNLISPLLDRWTIKIPDGEDITAGGDLFDHEYYIGRNGKTMARVSKAWVSLRESYGIEVFDDADVPLMIAIAVAIDDMMDAIYAEKNRPNVQANVNPDPEA
jgi:uncharacterized protein YxjI